MTHEEIKNIWFKNFPNSNILISKMCLGDGFHYRCILAKDKSEVYNGILENDALHYTFSIENENYEEYDNPCIFIKPESNLYAYSRVKLRRKNMKNTNIEKLEKRFLQVKNMIIENKDNFINLQYNINDKI